MSMLELDDIQALFIAPPRYPFGRYTFLSFDSADAGRAWLAQLANQIPSARWGSTPTPAAQVLASPVYVAFTANGLRALGVDDASLATFAEDFVAGMPARAEILGDTGPNSPEHWDGDVASDRLHAAVLLFASDADALAQRLAELEAFLAAHPGVTVLSFIDLAAADLSRPVEHFGYRDRISVVQIEGTVSSRLRGASHPASLVNSSWAIRTTSVSSRRCQNPRPFHVTARTSCTASCSSMSAPFVTSSARMRQRPMSRSYSPPS